MSSWFDLLQTEFNHATLEANERFRRTQEPVFPSKDMAVIYRAFDLTSPEDTRVVIIGQDPYPRSEHPTGLSFAVPPGTDPLPSSLANIKKELASDLGQELEDITLESWARQGCLMMNRWLTTSTTPKAHSSLLWEEVTGNAIRWLSRQDRPVVFVAWGAEAREFCKKRRGRVGLANPKHIMITSAHPCRRSASRGFFASRPFSQVNEWLVGQDETPIEWGREL